MCVKPVGINQDLNGANTMTDNKFKNYQSLRSLGRANARPLQRRYVN